MFNEMRISLANRRFKNLKLDNASYYKPKATAAGKYIVY